MNNQQFERLVHNLQDIMRCPHCSAKYDLGDINYLGQLDSMTFLHMRCKHCHTPVFASVALSNQDGDIIPTDITAEDVALADTSPVESEASNVGFEHRTMELTSIDQPIQEIPVENLPADELMASLSPEIPVAYDDVLDTHEYFKKFEGDFEELFKGVK